MAKNKSAIVSQYGLNFKDMAARYGKHPAFYCMVHRVGIMLKEPDLLNRVLKKLKKEMK